MDELLTPIRITTIKTSKPEEQKVYLKLSSSSSLNSVKKEDTPTTTLSARRPSSVEDALEILRSQPSIDELSTVLACFLQPTADDSTSDQNSAAFNITSISPLSSRIINALLVDTIPSFWDIFEASISHKSERNKLIQCLRSVTGLGGIVSKLRVLLGQLQASERERPTNVTLTKVNVENVERKESALTQIRNLMAVLGYLLHGDKVIQRFWNDLKYTQDKSPEDRKKELAWKEFVGLVAGGKVLSVAAEADIRLSEATGSIEERKFAWIGNGKQYTTWLRDNIIRMMDGAPLTDEETWKATALVLTKGFVLGYNEDLIEPRLFLSLSELNAELLTKMRQLLRRLKQHDKANYINTLLKLLSQKHLPVYLEEGKDYSQRISLITRIIYDLCIVEDGLRSGYQDILLDWILVTGGPGNGEPIGIRRAIIAAIKASPDGLTILGDSLESQVNTFGENLWIRHAPILHQEVNAQCLLLCAGYVHRKPSKHLAIIARSSPFMNGISAHLESTNIRVRFLGMVVGEAISSLADASGKQLKFIDAMDGSPEEVAKWKALVDVDDKLPDESIFTTFSKGLQSKDTPRRPKNSSKKTKKTKIVDIQANSGRSVVIAGAGRIQELDESSEDDLIPYPKPDSDPDDSDEDPTLVNRKKVSPPVYIRDLLYMLNEHDSFDKQQLGLSHAAVLIRRKASFGTEVSSHAVDLLTVLAGLQDKFEMENFENMRLKAIVALVVVLPLLAGPWISQRIFEGDYSLAQKCVMLSAIGIAAMELAGEEISEDSSLYQFQLSDSEKQRTEFPSKRLPQRLHDVYSSTPVDTLSNRLKATILQPIAAKAADELSGPSILKVRKFSTRMEVEANRKKPGVNKLSQVVVNAFFGPLMGRWWVFLKDNGSSSTRLVPHLLALYIKTLTVLLHATGPNNLALPQMVNGFWDLMLSLRHSPITLENSSVLDAILVGLLAMFEVCGDDKDKRRMAEETSKELVETQEWVSKIFEGSDGAEGSGESRKGLAAAVLLRCREVIERYERLLMGELIG